MFEEGLSQTCQFIALRFVKKFYERTSPIRSVNFRKYHLQKPLQVLVTPKIIEYEVVFPLIVLRIGIDFVQT